MEGDRGSRPGWVEWFPVEEQGLLAGFSGGDEDVFLVDVAGGRGHDIKAFKEKSPHARGRFVLEDLPHVVEQSLPELEQRVGKVGFDLFKPQPVKGSRIYYMKLILHDWFDEQSLEILGHIRDAMTPGYSKLIIEEFILPGKDCPMLPAMWDWEMMVICNSFERTQGRWKKLLDEAGFTAVFWAPPGDGQGIIEADIRLLN
ncbi:S-adenosyl-L-methionine-dependent methyltransferase [Aspergillus pseudoustus]|uniref:S-adenosyl-L-methionine-dependent methyltransferase n=1 Tax=Aspergillus pseudoustus TaxID=1810923 RepID=A0ABR4K944_9EURO